MEDSVEWGTASRGGQRRGRDSVEWGTASSGDVEGRSACTLHLEKDVTRGILLHHRPQWGNKSWTFISCVEIMFMQCLSSPAPAFPPNNIGQERIDAENSVLVRIMCQC